MLRLPVSAFTTIVGPGRRLSSWPCTATPAWCCGCRSSARPTGSSRCSPAATARSARWRRACGAPVRGWARGWSRSTTSTCSATPAARSTSSPRPRPSTRSARASSATTAATRPACAVLETADRLVAEEGEPALRVYLLVVGAMRALSRPRARPVARARRVPPARDGPRGLGPRDQRLRPLRRPGPAPGVQRRRRAARCARAAARRARSPRRGRRSCCSTPCCTATGTSPTRPPPPPAATPVGPGRRAPAVAPGAPAAVAAAGGAAGRAERSVGSSRHDGLRGRMRCCGGAVGAAPMTTEPPAPAPVRRAAARDPAEARAEPRRAGDGRQRAVGQRSGACRGSRGTGAARPSLMDVARGCIEIGVQVAVGSTRSPPRTGSAAPTRCAS